MKTKKIISVALVLIIFLINNIFVCVNAESITAQAVFGSEVTKNGIDTIVCKTDGTDTPGVSADVKIMGNRNCWALSASNVARVNFTLSADMKAQTLISRYDFEIEYFDGGKGFLVLEYDSVNQTEQIADIIYTTGSNSWKKAEITVDNAYFANRLDSSDFRLAVVLDGTRKTSSESSVGIGSIKITKKDNPFSVVVSTDVSGNTFEWHNESKPINARIQNNTDSSQTLTLGFSLKNGKNRVYYQETKENVSIAKGKSKTLTIDIGDVQNCDIYDFTMTLQNADNSIVMELNPCTIAIVKTDPNGVKNEDVGFASHLEWYNTEIQDAGIDMLHKSNSYGIRSNFDWDSMETVKGELDFNNSNMNNIVKKLYENEMKLIPILSGPSKFYFPDETPEDVWQVFPTTEEQLEGWKKYVRYTAEQLKPYSVTEYEVWNEPNLQNFNKYEADGRAYTNLFSATKAEIKAVDSAAKVGGAALTGIDGTWGKEYFSDMLAGGIADSMDAITLHPYIDANAAVEESTKEESIGWYLDEYAKYSSKVPEIWHTEVGYSSAEDGIDEDRKGALNVRTALLYKAKGLGDKIMFYNFEKKGYVQNDKENQYGHVSPASPHGEKSGVSFVPTSAYAMVTGMNYLMAQSESDTIYDSPNGNVRVLSFNSAKMGNKKVLAVYALDTPEYTVLNLGADSAEFYDAYGNCEPLVGNNGSFIVYATDEPCYLVGDFNSMEFSTDSFVKISDSRVNVSENGFFRIDIEKNTDTEYEITAETPDNALLVKNNSFVGNNASVVFKNNAEIGEIGRITLKIKDNGETAAMFYVDVNTLYEAETENTIMIEAASGQDFAFGDRVQLDVSYGNATTYQMDFLAKYELYLDGELKYTDTECHSIESESVCGDVLIVPETAPGEYLLKITVLQGEAVINSKELTFIRHAKKNKHIFKISGIIPSGKEGTEVSMTAFDCDNDTYNEDGVFNGIYTDQVTTGVGGSFRFNISVPYENIRVYIVPEEGKLIDFTFRAEEEQTIIPYLARGMVKIEHISASETVQPNYMVEFSGLESDIKYNAYCALYKENFLVSVIKLPDSVTAEDLVYKNYGPIAEGIDVDYDSIKLLLWSKDGQTSLCLPYMDQAVKGRE